MTAAPVDLTRTTVRCPHLVCEPIAAAAVPVDFSDALFAIAPQSRHLVSTTAAPAYYPNSLRLKTLTVAAKDHRLEAINAIATLAAGAADLAKDGMNLSNGDPTIAQLELPVTIALADLRCTASPCALTKPPELPRNPGWTYALTWRDDPAAAGLLARARMGEVHGAMVVSACRPARLTLTRAPDVTVILDVLVADPTWLVTVPFPAKGAMTFHSLCGVDVQPQAVTQVGVDEMAAAFANGVKQIAAPK